MIFLVQTAPDSPFGTNPTRHTGSKRSRSNQLRPCSNPAGAPRTFESCRAAAVPTTATDHGVGRRHRHAIGRWVDIDWAAPMRHRSATDGRADQSCGLGPGRVPTARSGHRRGDLTPQSPTCVQQALNKDEPGRKSGAAVDNISSPLDAVLQICSQIRYRPRE